jgi:hypothetical protein
MAATAYQIQGGPHGPLGVVLAGGGGTPHGHDRVADELLDHPAVTADQPPAGVEVAGQQLPDLLRVAPLR